MTRHRIAQIVKNGNPKLPETASKPTVSSRIDYLKPGISRPAQQLCGSSRALISFDIGR
jgi:hypothetical protein